MIRKPSVKAKPKKHRLSPFKKKTQEEVAGEETEHANQTEVPATDHNNNNDNIAEANVTQQEGQLQEQSAGDPANEPIENNESDPLHASEKLCSDTIAFTGFIPRNTTDEQLREFFKGFDPQEIIVFKNKMFRRGFSFHRHFTAALITFPDADKLNDCLLYTSRCV